MNRAGVGRGIPVRGASCVYKLEARALGGVCGALQEGPQAKGEYGMPAYVVSMHFG